VRMRIVIRDARGTNARVAKFGEATFFRLRRSIVKTHNIRTLRRGSGSAAESRAGLEFCGFSIIYGAAEAML
jgi:hypothetical protein